MGVASGRGWEGLAVVAGAVGASSDDPDGDGPEEDDEDSGGSHGNG